MTSNIDPATGFPLGPPIDPSPARRPQHCTLEGRYVTLAPLDPAAHADALWNQTGGPGNDHLWLYLFSGPFQDRAGFQADLEKKAVSVDPLFFAILDKISGGVVGYACFMRIEPAHRCIEVGSILFAPALQRTRGATEAMYLMARHVFEDQGWIAEERQRQIAAQRKASRRAALRLGFTFEGVFRQHMIVKGRSRDTAWFSMLDAEWPERKAAFERWLDPSNFDAQGKQKSSLLMCGASTTRTPSLG